MTETQAERQIIELEIPVKPGEEPRGTIQMGATTWLDVAGLSIDRNVVEWLNKKAGADIVLSVDMGLNVRVPFIAIGSGAEKRVPIVGRDRKVHAQEAEREKSSMMQPTLPA